MNLIEKIHITLFISIIILVVTNRLQGQFVNQKAITEKEAIHALVNQSEELPKDSANLKIDLLKQALVKSEVLNDRLLITEIYIGFGKIYQSDYQFDDAIVNFNKASLLAKDLENDSLMKIAIAGLGVINGMKNNPKLAKQYFEQLLDLGEKSNDTQTVARANNNLGVISEHTGNLGDALTYYSEALELWDKRKDTLKMSSCLNNLGNIYYRLGDYQKSLEIHLKALSYRNKLKDKKRIAISLSNIGSIYEALHKYNKAIEFQQSSISIKKELKDINGLASSYTNLGNIYNDIQHYDTALVYYEKSLEIWEKYKNKKAVSLGLNNIASVYEKTGKEKKAEKLYLRAIKISNSIDAKYDLSEMYNNIGRLYFNQKKYKKALIYLNEAKDISEKNKSLDILSTTLNLLAKANYNLMNYKEAANYFRQKNIIKDSLFDIQKEREVEKLTILYSNNQGKKNSLIEKERIEWKQIFNRNKKLISASIFVLLIISLTILLLVIKIIKLKALKKEFNKTVSWFYAILEATNDGIIIFDVKGNVFKANEKFKKIWNIPDNWNNEARNKTRFNTILEKLTNEDDFIKETNRLTGTMLERDHVILETVNGQSFEMYSLAFHVNGIKNGTMWSFRNLTDRKKAIDALKISQQRYQMVVERSINGIAILQDFKARFVNNALINITGYSKEELMSFSFEKLIPKDKVKEIKERYEKRLRGEDVTSRYELSVIGKNNKIIYFEIDASLIDYESRPAVLAFFRDISKRKIAEDELKKLSSAVEVSPITVVITDKDGNIEYVNPFFTEKTGYTIGEVFGKNPRVLKSGNQTIDFYKNLWETILSGKVWYGEFQNKKKSGELYWENAVISPIMNRGKITNFVAIKNDITELKRANEKLIANEKELKEHIITKDKFFSIVAHDLKNPFNSLIGFTELMLQNKDKLSSKKLYEYISIISQTAKSGYNLLENLLYWGRSQSGKIDYSPEKINIKEIAEEVFELNKTGLEKKNIQLEINANDNLFVFADKNTITTVLRNLVSNSIKYSYPNSKIKIKASLTNKFVQISVKDEGVGIEEKDINKLFKLDSNFSTPGTEAEKGTGLGLILCKDFVEHNGGEIWVESKKNKGTTFFFTIPIT
ncbi:MAG: tetratricopeptide repeat protein [Chlorobi bacterium]|nr:tetratricopeptide repeat protein [Chlorobiota bacterium]